MSTVINATRGLLEHEHAAFITTIESALKIDTTEQYLQWTQKELQVLFPHESLICGVGEIDKNGMHIRHMLSSGFPVDYVRGLARPDGGVTSPVMAKWCREHKPQLFEPEDTKLETTPAWLAQFYRFRLHNIAAHGLRDQHGNAASYFSFSRIPGTLTPHHAHLLELLVPPMHGALIRVLANKQAVQPKAATVRPVISVREQEVLHWLREGKTNWEIAQILGLSEKTVKNHVQHIMVKLRVNNRTQAVAKAISIKLIRARMNPA
ncbi:MAG: XrtB/PEP-CTERM-associated transcriptional regulator EpsA [Thiobacillaceae bacterium]